MSSADDLRDAIREALVDPTAEPVEPRPVDEPTVKVVCTWCETEFNQDPDVDERNFLKLHEGTCVNKPNADRAFYRVHRRWPRRPPAVEDAKP